MKAKIASIINLARQNLKRLKNLVYKEIKAHDCPHCGAMIFDKDNRMLARGYNHLCRQSSGDWGWFCKSCHKVHYEHTLEEYLDIEPDWCSCEGHVGRGTKSGFTDYVKDYLLPDGKYAK